MDTKKKPLTLAQKIFGSEFGNAAIITKRPEGMPFAKYKAMLNQQNRVIKSVLR